MASSFFVDLLFAHIIADYFLQPQWMALQKSEASGRGHRVCALHCAIYALVVGLATVPWVSSNLGIQINWILFIGLGHYPVDRWSLGDKWLRLIGGRNYRSYRAGHSSGRSMALEGGFYAVVYTVVDNGIHLMVAYYGIRLFV